MRAGFRRPRLVPSLAALVGLAVLLGLGLWQLERLEQKRALIARIETRMAADPAPLPARLDAPESWVYRRATVTGRYDHQAEIRLQSRTHDGRAGGHIVTPLIRAQGAPVIVNRGWVPMAVLRRMARDGAAAPIARPAGRVTIEAIARAPERPGWFTPPNDPEAGQWFWLDPEALGRHAGLATAPAPILLDAAPGQHEGRYPLGGQTRLDIRNEHLEYALTWFALAAGLVAIFILAHRRGSALRR